MLAALEKRDAAALQELIATGAPWTGCGKEHYGFEMTPLMWAANAQWPEAVEALVRSGSPLDEETSDGDTAISLTMHQSGVNISQTLITLILLHLPGDLLTPGSDGREPSAHVTAQLPLPELTSRVRSSGVRCISLNRRARTGWNMLFRLVEHDSSEKCAFLAAAGADLEFTDNAGDTLLFTAISNKSSASMDALLAYGANVEHTTEKGFTPLIYSIECNRPDFTRKLLVAGADPRRISDKVLAALTHESTSPAKKEAADMVREWTAMLDLRDSLAETIPPPVGRDRKLAL